MVRNTSILEERKQSIIDRAGFCQGDGKGISCDTSSVSGAVSQRACVFSGARVVLNPITDAYHIIHGPIGCSSYTWDIRGSLTSGSDVFRTSYSTDLRETDVIFGGEKKLAAAIDELVEKTSAKLIFVYATCIVGVIGDDIEAICKKAEEKYGIRVIAVKASGFSGTKSQGYKLACDAIMHLIMPFKDIPKVKGINFLGDYNLAGEMWLFKNYMKKIGINVVATATGDASYESLIKMPSAQLNIVQCAGSSSYLASRMEEEMGIPFIKVSFFGAEDTSASILRIAQALGDEQAIQKALAFTAVESIKAEAFLENYRPRFAGKKAAIYVGGGFKAISLIKQFNEMGIEIVTEEGTVFGGKENLIKGLENLIKLYDPEVIGVSTSCLAETIGEDVDAIIKEFYTRNKNAGVTVVNVSSAGYGGTQYEGWNKALWSIVSQVEMDPTPNGCVNIITPMLSPADCRQLKSVLAGMGLDFILLPDLSDNLDGVYVRKYERLKGGGTSLEDIKKMAGAVHTIELSLFNDEKYSPAKLLSERYGVPYTKMALPVGIRDTDAFIEKLVSLGGLITDELIKERGRYLDAMIDAHKYCAQGRAAIFGEPDFVYSMTRLCCETGTVPGGVFTGSVCQPLKNALNEDVRSAADNLFAGETVILDDCDFDRIEHEAKRLGVNVLIGSSDGRRMAHRLGLEIIRCAFPIHDRVGGQRIKTLLYSGSLDILDQLANVLLGNKEESFRDEIYDRYIDGSEKPSEDKKPGILNLQDITAKTEKHPCFNCSGGKYARIHLPVAPACNIQCNYCVRKYDCPNESRPGVTTAVLSPEEAYERYLQEKSKVDNLTVVGIAGPGDALANFSETKKTLRLIKESDPNVTFCLSTNGLMLPLYAQELIDLGVSHVTVTVNAVDPKIGANIYKHINYLGTKYTGIEAASILLANQLSGIRYLTSRGIICKVNTVMLKGINAHHIDQKGPRPRRVYIKHHAADPRKRLRV